MMHLWKLREDHSLTLVSKTDDERCTISFGLTILSILELRQLNNNYLKLAGAFKEYIPNLSVSDASILKRILDPEIARNRPSSYKASHDLEEELEWFRFLIVVLQEASTKNPKSVKIRLLIAYICYHKLDKKWQAIYCLLSAKEMQPTLLQECSILRY